MYNILCFGDSNTYGYKPDGSGRFDKNTRWTGRLQDILGNDYYIIEEGLCGRTTIFEDNLRPGRKGIDDISRIMESHNPLDLVIIMLGTNDCKTAYNAQPEDIGNGIQKIINVISGYKSEQPGILVISPIHLGEGVGEDGYDTEFCTRSEKISQNLANEYEKISKRNNCFFADASKIASASSIDREHLDEEGHKKISIKISEIVMNISKNYKCSNNG